MKVLSKSRLLRGVQCRKSLFLTLFHPELEEESDAATEQRFDDGNLVGELAQKEFPGGVLIEGDHRDISGYVARTKEAMASGATTLYEASFQWRDFFCRADILRKSMGNSWDIVEVKMTASVKDVHLTDLAIQRIILEESGLTVRKTILMHLNTGCEFPDLSNLFTQEDVTARVADILQETQTEMLGLAELVRSKSVPEISIGPHCSSPYECGFRKHCWAAIPKPSIFDIPKIKPWKYFERGIFQPRDLPKEELSDSILKFVESHKNGARHVDTKAVRAEMSTWEWPLVLLDFETISYPVPCVDGTSPYEQIPFQAACSVWEKDGAVKVFDFLDVTASDPRRPMAEYLCKLPEQGSVVAYNKSFESRVIQSLAERFPDLEERLLSLSGRLVDPLPLFRSSIYDPKFGSSFSLKAVAPAILGDAASYSGLEVADGGGAQIAYRTIRDPNTPETDRKRLTKALVAYCRKDTETMRQLVEWLLRI